MNSASHYDVAIIGAGMSGLAAGIRLAHFGRRVCIFERHNAPGGLNGFYSLAGRKYDVGLHALTNYVGPEVKNTPLGRILRQLRIDRAELDLAPQHGSRVSFGPQGETSLRFTNDPSVLSADIAEKFPREIDGWRALLAALPDYDALAEATRMPSARGFMSRFLHDPLLVDMLLCPLMFYGSAQEHDMDVAQFAIMARAIYLEGLARPFEGVRTILRVLLEKYRAAGGERRMKCGVQRIIPRDGRAAVLALDDGTEVAANQVISSIGAAETEWLVHLGRGEAGEETAPPADAGRLSFVEAITVFNRPPAAWGWGGDTIVFFNDSPRFHYARPAGEVDPRSGVICIPNNFDYGAGRALAEGIFRVTCLADYDHWANLEEEDYRADKARWFGETQRSARRFLPPVDEAAIAAATVATDMFTPRTITKYTGHFGGAVYGSPRKAHDGRTSLENLFLCGTDQGFVGIVGALLSGIAMANRHILQSAR